MEKPTPPIITVYREMRCDMPEGTVLLRWPEPISVDSIERMTEIIALQLRGVARRATAAAVENDNAWDERRLGHDERFAQRAPQEAEDALEAAVRKPAEDSDPAIEGTEKT